MSDDVFIDPKNGTDPETAERPNSPDDSETVADDWADVRMTDPEEGEWNIDAVVVNGHVEYVDLQVRPNVISGFVGCLLDDVSGAAAREILVSIAEGQNLDLSEGVAEE